MSDMKKRMLYKGIGLLFSTVPTAVTVISYFPLWHGEGAKSMLSGISLCLILICAVPIFRMIRGAWRTPSAPLVWFIVFLLFSALSRIAADIAVIALVGFISNLIGSLFFMLAKAEKENEEE